MTKSTKGTHLFAAFLLASVAPLATVQKGNSSSSKKNDSVYDALARAPKKAFARHNPLQSDPDAVAAGAKLFALHCAECHGEMAEGGRKAPSLLADQVLQATPGTLFGSSATGSSVAVCLIGPSYRNRSAGRS